MEESVPCTLGDTGGDALVVELSPLLHTVGLIIFLKRKKNVCVCVCVCVSSIVVSCDVDVGVL